jgi:hypothetical protein
MKRVAEMKLRRLASRKAVVILHEMAHAATITTSGTGTR